ncbi:MAG: hypothetical protein ACTSVW_01440 [Candidatus Njordarchaeales archaeon]
MSSWQRGPLLYCKRCGNIFEELYAIRGRGSIKCPLCGWDKIGTLNEFISNFRTELTKRVLNLEKFFDSINKKLQEIDEQAYALESIRRKGILCNLELEKKVFELYIKFDELIKLADFYFDTINMEYSKLLKQLIDSENSRIKILNPILELDKISKKAMKRMTLFKGISSEISKKVQELRSEIEQLNSKYMLLREMIFQTGIKPELFREVLFIRKYDCGYVVITKNHFLYFDSKGSPKVLVELLNIIDIMPTKGLLRKGIDLILFGDMRKKIPIPETEISVLKGTIKEAIRRKKSKVVNVTFLGEINILKPDISRLMSKIASIRENLANLLEDLYKKVGRNKSGTNNSTERKFGEQTNQIRLPEYRYIKPEVTIQTYEKDIYVKLLEIRTLLVKLKEKLANNPSAISEKYWIMTKKIDELLHILKNPVGRNIKAMEWFE